MTCAARHAVARRERRDELVGAAAGVAVERRARASRSPRAPRGTGRSRPSFSPSEASLGGGRRNRIARRKLRRATAGRTGRRHSRRDEVRRIRLGHGVGAGSGAGAGSVGSGSTGIGATGATGATGSQSPQSSPPPCCRRHQNRPPARDETDHERASEADGACAAAARTTAPPRRRTRRRRPYLACGSAGAGTTSRSTSRAHFDVNSRS